MLRSTLRPGRALALALALAAAAPRPAAATVLVESAQAPPGSLSPLAPGDELLRWQQSGPTPLRSGDFAHWGDLDLLAFLESPRGTLEIDLLRQGEPRRVTLPRAAWTFRGRPTGMDPALVERVAQLAARESTATFEQVEPLVAGAPSEVRSWAWARFAGTAGKRSDWLTAVRAFAAAIPLSPPHVAADLERLHGDALRRLNRLDEAEAAYRRALALWEGLEPRSLGSTFATNAIANLRAAQYELAEANRLFLEVAEIRGRLAPGSWLHANALNGLGTTAGRRNDLAAAERHFEEALALAERGQGDPGPPLSNLGIVCRLRGDFERAEMYTRRALELYRAADNRSEVADKWVNLANILGDARRFDEALAVYGEALAELEGDAPDREALGTALANRANLHWLRRDLAAMAADLAAARAQLAFTRPRTATEAMVTSLEVELARARGDLDEAARLAVLTLEVREQIQPDSSFVALAASDLAGLRAAQGRAEEAEALHRRALQALDRQQQRLGGGDRGLVAFRAKFAGIYRAYQEFLLARGRAEAAFEIYERSRARALLALLGERDLELAESDLPPALARRRRELALEIEKAYLALARLASEAAAERETLRLKLETLHAERERLDREAHAGSARLSAIEAPPALGLAEIRRALAPGTLLLAYSLGPESSILFALAADGGLTAHPLAAGEPAIAADVARWRELTTATALGRGELAALERRLSDSLLSPVAGRLADARRLLVVPDGALHGLAFAALPDPRQPSRRLIEALPVAHQVSGSVHAALARRGAPAPIARVAVFADPATGSTASARYRRDFGRLPASQREAARVGEVFGGRARLFVDAEATEAAARREIASASLAHFACHALVDEALPLDSALLLAPSGAEEGLLQAWEIAEQVRLASDLVVLSACETARGAERGGEGILGLVRALQVAGARSVVASLWRVDDESAAELMARFYARMNEGLPRDEALRQAQLALLRGPIEVERDGHRIALRTAEPRHWAPFVLIGPAD